MSDLQYPIGKYVQPAAFTEAARRAAIAGLAAAPAALRAAVEGLNDAQLDTPYRIHRIGGGRWAARGRGLR